MDYKRYYDVLFQGIETDAAVKELVHGISWTAAVLSNGSVGVAMHTPGDTAPRIFPDLTGMPAREAARAALSWNMEEANEGMAVVNACYNTLENRRALGAEYGGDGHTLTGIDVSGKTVGFVGHLVGNGGITKEDLKDARKYYILDRERPRPGDYPDSACEYLLPECDLVVMTGSTAMNKTLPRLLELCGNAEVILTGPSVTLCRELFDFGVTRLYGNVITEKEAMLRSIVGKPGSVERFSTRFILDAAR